MSKAPRRRRTAAERLVHAKRPMFGTEPEEQRRMRIMVARLHEFADDPLKRLEIMQAAFYPADDELLQQRLAQLIAIITSVPELPALGVMILGTIIRDIGKLELVHMLDPEARTLLEPIYEAIETTAAEFADKTEDIAERYKQDTSRFLRSLFTELSDDDDPLANPDDDGRKPE